VLDPDGVMHEVTTFRRDVRTDGRHAEVEFGVSLEDDLARRDFTINAIAYSPSRDELRDPFDGQGDIGRRLVRAVGDADARMREDRLRALRALRFASRFDFAIEPLTLEAIRGSAPHLGRLSAERVKQELEKTMDQVRAPGRAFVMWKETGAFATLIPALASAPDDVLSVPNRLALPTSMTRPQRRLVRMAGLFATVDGSIVQRTLTDLRFSKQDTQWITSVVTRWQEVGPEIEAATSGGGHPTDATVRTWVARIGRLHLGAVMRLAAAVWAVRPSSAALSSRTTGRLYRRMMRVAFRDPIELRDLAVDGDDLRRAGISTGPALGIILQALLKRVLEDPSLNQTDWLLQEGIRMHRTHDAVTGNNRHGD
jgi:tRNA nucleotidyltransferase (CCA-adding enzyme)